MMRGVTETVLVTLLFLIAACGQGGGRNDAETKYIYQLCPKSEASRQELSSLMKSFARRNGAQIFDRASESQNEIAEMDNGADILESTGGNLILLTLEKPDVYIISTTNLRLKEKVVLTVTYLRDSSSETEVQELLKEIEGSWNVQRVAGGVTNDPACGPTARALSREPVLSLPR
jgi:hypothetical protein